VLHKIGGLAERAVGGHGHDGDAAAAVIRDDKVAAGFVEGEVAGTGAAGGALVDEPEFAGGGLDGVGADRAAGLEGFMARLDFVDVRGETITRTLSGDTCDEVVSGIALVTALALEAQHEPAGEASDTTPPVPSDPAADDPPVVAEAPPEPPDAAVKTTDIPRSGSRRKPRRRARAERPRFLHGAGVGGGNAWYLAPSTPAVFDAAFRLGHTSLAGSARAGFRSWLSSTTAEGRRASFLGYAGSLEVCPVEWPRSGGVRFEPCLGTTLGVLEAEGDPSVELPTTESARIFWADARGIARVRLALTELVELEGQGEVGAPLRSHRFLFQDPEETVFEVPGAGLGWRAGVMLHFP
jgi:hypothetical protein